MLIWLFVLVAMGLAAAGAGYALLRLRPTVLFLRDRQNQIAAEVSLGASSQSDFDEAGWRNDERRLSRMLDKQEKTSALLSADLSGAKKDIAGAASSLKEQQATLVRMSGVNAAKSLSHSRALSDEACRRALEELCPTLGIKFTDRHLYDIADRICVLESQCHGRLATSVDAMVMRMLAGVHAAQRATGEFRLLEIGTLYGIAAAALYDVTRFYAKKTHVTLIDPLDGYYGEDKYDFCSVKPVTRAVLEENLAICRVPPGCVEILQGKSEDPAILQSLKGREFDLLIIDGDHSREGVERDFDNYYPLLRSNGLLIIDDYGVKEWPEIKSYADKLVLPRADVQLTYKGSRTLILRKV